MQDWVERQDANGTRSYRYRLELANATGILHFLVDAQNKVTASSGRPMKGNLGRNRRNP
jgi:hypothetical protein